MMRESITEVREPESVASFLISRKGTLEISRMLRTGAVGGDAGFAEIRQLLASHFDHGYDADVGFAGG